MRASEVVLPFHFSDAVRWGMDVCSRYKGIIFLAFFLGLGASAFRSFLLAKPFYTSTVHLMASWSPFRTDVRSYETCFLVFDATKVYGTAADRLGLREKWGLPSEACASRLMRMCQISTVGKTHIIAVSAQSTDPAQAQAFAAEVAESYIQDRIEYHAQSVTSTNTEVESIYKDLKRESEYFVTLMDKRRAVASSLYLEGLKGRPRAICMLRSACQRADDKARKARASFDILRATPPSQRIKLPEARTNRSRDDEVRVMRAMERWTREAEEAAANKTEQHPLVQALRAMQSKSKEHALREADDIVMRAWYEALVAELESQAVQEEFRREAVNFMGYLRGISSVTAIEDALNRQRSLLRTYRANFNKAELWKEVPIVLIETIAPASTAQTLAKAPIWNAVLGGGVALLFGVGIVLLVEGSDLSMEVADRIEKELKLTLLGAIPHHIFFRRLQSRNFYVESYRVLKTQIQFALTPFSGKILLITSSGPREGKSTTAANLAIVWAQSGKRVLLIDCDLVRPTVHKMFGCERSPGLAEYLAGQEQDFPVPTVTKYPGLSVLPGGRCAGSSSLLLESPRWTDFLTHLKEEFDAVLLDCTPVLGFSHVLVLSCQCDGVLFVVEAGRYAMREGREALALLRRCPTPLLGVCLNKIDLDNPGRVYHGYYRYYSHYGTYHDYESPEGSEGLESPQGGSGLIEIKESSHEAGKSRSRRG